MSDQAVNYTCSSPVGEDEVDISNTGSLTFPSAAEKLYSPQ